jgi:hypothetical protein
MNFIIYTQSITQKYLVITESKVLPLQFTRKLKYYDKIKLKGYAVITKYDRQ